MFQKLKKIFAKVALVALMTQMMVMVAPSGAHAAVGPTANVVHTLATKTINYEFTQPVELRNNDNSPAVLTADKLHIFEVDGVTYNYDWSTRTDAFANVKSVVLSADAKNATIVYIGSLVKPANTRYVVDAWGYQITDASGNKVQPSTLQTFEVNGDNIAPTATVAHNADAKTITYTFTEPIELRNNDNTPAELTVDKLGIYVVTAGNYLASDKTSNAITSVVLNSESTVATITYDGYLQKQLTTDYVVDAWGYLITDVAGNRLMASVSQIFSVAGDATAPVITTSFKPLIVNSLGKTIDVYFSSNEPMIIGAFTYKQDGVAYLPVNPTVVNPDSSDLALFHSIQIPSGFFTGAMDSLEVGYTATDEAGNSFVGKVTIPVDTIAPAAVTNLVATVNVAGNVVLSWVNPADGYVGLQVKRDGVFLTTLPVGTTSYVDSSVVRGTTYSYTVTAYDAAGNETMTTPVQITVPLQMIAAAASDSHSYVAPAETQDQGTVTSTDNAADTKGDENKKTEEGLPFWAIILLVALAAIGGYLIYNQKPVTTPVVPVAKKGTNNVPKKTTPKK